MGKMKEDQRVAVASKGQVYFNAIGLDAAIKAYRASVLDSDKVQEKIRELIGMGDFCREVCRDEEAIDAYERAITLCLENERRNQPRFLEYARYCASAADGLLADRMKNCPAMMMVVDFYADHYPAKK